MNIYDCGPYGRLDKDNTECIKWLMFPQKTFDINYIEVQQQSGKNDCGLCSLPYATTLCNRHEPNITYLQPKLREHLFGCLLFRKNNAICSN